MQWRIWLIIALLLATVGTVDASRFLWIGVLLALLAMLLEVATWITRRERSWKG